MALNLLFSRPGGGGGGSIPLSATISPTELFGYSPWGTVISEQPAICNVTGGLPPYSYLWVRVSGPAIIRAQSLTNYATYFTMGGKISANESAVFKCTVTDSASTVVDSSTVLVNLVRETE